MKKQTILIEPDEIPVPGQIPEIKQPSDPQQPAIPQEDPIIEPEEVSPGEINRPEIQPQEK